MRVHVSVRMCIAFCEDPGNVAAQFRELVGLQRRGPEVEMNPLDAIYKSSNFHRTSWEREIRGQNKKNAKKNKIVELSN